MPSRGTALCSEFPRWSSTVHNSLRAKGPGERGVGESGKKFCLLTIRDLSGRIHETRPSFAAGHGLDRERRRVLHLRSPGPDHQLPDSSWHARGMHSGGSNLGVGSRIWSHRGRGGAFRGHVGMAALAPRAYAIGRRIVTVPAFEVSAEDLVMAEAHNPQLLKHPTRLRRTGSPEGS